MHRPPLRVHARDIKSQVGLLEQFAKAVKLDKFSVQQMWNGLANRFKRRYGIGRTYPRQSAREKLRRRVGGFARLHRHMIVQTEVTVYGTNQYGEPMMERLDVLLRRCPVCDLGIPHADLEKAA